jgi:hypothetical protein
MMRPEIVPSSCRDGQIPGALSVDRHTHAHQFVAGTTLVTARALLGGAGTDTLRATFSTPINVIVARYGG